MKLTLSESEWRELDAEAVRLYNKLPPVRKFHAANEEQSEQWIWKIVAELAMKGERPRREDEPIIKQALQDVLTGTIEIEWVSRTVKDLEDDLGRPVRAGDLPKLESYRLVVNRDPVKPGKGVKLKLWYWTIEVWQGWRLARICPQCGRAFIPADRRQFYDRELCRKALWKEQRRRK